MTSPLTILWRGPLDSCNYGCRYCPFAKRAADRTTLDADRAALSRFMTWVQTQESRPLSILFTPWGEALIHPWYRDSLKTLSRLAHVSMACIQTNGSSSFTWVSDVDACRLALWITWHPSEISQERFLANLKSLFEHQVRFSIGAVGVPDHLVELERLRQLLPGSVPFWINAQKPTPGYSPSQIARFSAIDPHFHHTLKAHASRDRSCRTGDSVIAVDGEGIIRRCHFIYRPLGNLYVDDLDSILKPRACTRSQCDCYIGYAHLDHLQLDEIYGQGLLARIPHVHAP